MKDKIYIENLSFYWHIKGRKEDKNLVPDFLPFESDYEDKLGFVIQKRNRRVLRYLEKIYQEEPNIGHNQEISNWSSFYGEDFMNFFEGAISKYKHKIKKVLEIGCGGCLLLERLKKKGFKAMGIDPSSFSQKEGKKRGINVIRDFFPSKEIKGKFDLIYHSNVIEHIVDPVGFLKSQAGYLGNNGILILAVPNCTESILNGDISMFYHQHLNYFDVESLKITIENAGFRIIRIKRAKFGGNLYVLATKSSGKGVISSSFNWKEDKKYDQFLNNYQKLTIKLKKYIEKILDNKTKTVGFYAPLRVLPYLAVFNLCKNNKIRFFDDTSYWHRKYFDGINIPIENFEDLKRNPVTDLVIMSPTFGRIIKDKVIKQFGKRIKIKKLTDFYGNRQ